MNASTQSTDSGDAEAPSLYLHQAVTLARKGRFFEADQLLHLAEDADECTHAQIMDLRARMFAQQGMLVKAEACWIEALAEDPGNPIYTRAIARLRRSNNPARRAQIAILVTALLIAANAALSIEIVANRHLRQAQQAMEARMLQMEASLNAMQAAICGLQHQTEIDGKMNAMHKPADGPSSELHRLLVSVRDAPRRILWFRLR